MMQCVYMTTPTSWLCWTSVPMSCKVLKLSTFTEPNSTTRSPTLSPCIGPGRTMKSLYQKWLHRSLVCTCVCVSLSLSFSLSLSSPYPSSQHTAIAAGEPSETRLTLANPFKGGLLSLLLASGLCWLSSFFSLASACNWCTFSSINFITVLWSLRRPMRRERAT